MKKNKFLYCSSFILKIIAIVSMSLDHIGVILGSLYPQLDVLVTILRYLGRFALPLYAFLIVEGVIHTKNIKKYLSRLFVMAGFISILLLLFEYISVLEMQSVAREGNIFLDLGLGCLLIYLINQPDKRLKPLAIIPFAIGILSFVVKGYEASTNYVIKLAWYPYFLRLQYDWFSLALMLGFYISYRLAKLYFEYQSRYSGIMVDNVIGTATWRVAVNLISIGFLIIINIIYYGLSYFFPSIVFWIPGTQLFSIVTSIFIVSYNGIRGYDKPWFRIFSYLYYPLHIAVLYAIIYLLYIII